jgi:hypothetical protein
MLLEGTIMDSQVIIQTGNWKIKVILGLGGLVTIIILAFMYRLELGLILLACGGIAVTRLGFWVKHKLVLEKLQERQIIAQTKAIEIETIRAHWQARQEQALAQKMAYDALFVERRAGTFAVGNIPFGFYPSAPASAQLATAPALALPAGNLDFYKVMSNPEQVYAIVGPQRIGKSILAQHLAQHLTRAGWTCLVIGTKARQGEWAGCKRFIGNEQVLSALGSVLAETVDRLAVNRTIPPLAVFLDDWLNSVAIDGKLAEQFFLESATRMLTAGIVPYFLLQSDSKTDWGTKHGATLKNNFVHLLLTAPRENGELNRDKLRGVVVYPGEKTQHGVSLPAGLLALGDDQPDLELAEPLAADAGAESAEAGAGPAFDLAERVLTVFDSGAATSPTAVCTKIYGWKNQERVAAVAQILRDHNRLG